MIDTLDRIFDVPFFSRSGLRGLASPFLSTFRPPWDFVETGSSCGLRIDLTGLRKEEAEVYAEDGNLVVKGEHKDEDNNNDDED